MGKEPEFDLGVVGAYEYMAAFRGNEAPSYLPATLCPYGDVLHVRVAGAQPAGGGDRLVETGVNKTGLPVDIAGKLLDIGVLKLGEFPELYEGLNEGMLTPEGLQNGYSR